MAGTTKASATGAEGAQIAMGVPRARAHRRVALSARALSYVLGELGASRRPPAVLARARDRRVRRIVAHAHRNVPFYREEMDAAGISPAQIRTADDLARLPLVERSQLQADPERFMDESRRRDECVTFRTGGSTGRPVTVVHDLRDLLEKNAATGRARTAMAAAGAPRIRRRIARVQPARSSGEKLAVAADQNNLLTALDPRAVELRLSSGRDATDLIADLNLFKPHVIAGYGSAIEELFAHSLASATPISPPAAIAYGADQLSDGARTLLGDRLGIQVFSTYRAVESPMIGFECLHHTGLHVNTDICPVRILGAGGSDLGPGDQGEVVISNLICRTTVLLNYRLGDLAAWRGEPCPCGRTLPVMSLIDGRASVYFTDATGRRFPAQLAERAFSSQADVLGYRIEANEAGVLAAEVLPLAGADLRDLEERIRASFLKLVGERPPLEVEFVERLTRTEAGKVCRVVAEPTAGAESAS